MRVADLLRPPSPGGTKVLSNEAIEAPEPADNGHRNKNLDRSAADTLSEGGTFIEFSLDQDRICNVGAGNRVETAQSLPAQESRTASDVAETSPTPEQHTTPENASPRAADPRFVLEHPVARASDTTKRQSEEDAPSEPDNPPAKKRRVGRPRKADADLKRPRAEKYRTLNRPPRIHGNSIVHTKLPVEIWDNICLYMDPRTMINLRLTCKKLNEQISSPGFLKQYRELHFGEECPPPPDGISELKYMHLLGCSSGCGACGARKTQKVQWAFFTRLCDKCLDERVFKIGSQILPQSTFVGRYARLIACIPKAEIDTHANYAGIMLNPEPFTPQTALFNGSMFLKKDFGKIANEFENFKSTINPMYSPAAREQELVDWILARKEKCDEAMKPRKEIEDHVQDIEWLKKGTSYSQRKLCQMDRLVFFREKCDELDPPIPPEHLALMPPFQEALKYNRPASQSSWQQLKPKILALRDAAAEMYNLKGPEFPAPRSAEYERCRLAHENHPVHALLCKIAVDVVRVLKGHSNHKGPVVSPCDLPYIALRKVRDVYYKIPKGDRPQASKDDLLEPQDDGTYTLCMDDALKTYTDRIVPSMESWTYFRQKEGKVLRCPGCLRKDYFRGRTFRQLFEHLMKKHGTELASDWAVYYKTALEYGQYPDMPSDGFPWLALPWPLHLPIQAVHQKAAGRWDPEGVGFQYKLEGRTTKRGGVRESAFANRSPAPLEAPGELHADLVAALTHAWDALQPLGLKHRERAAVAWRHAVYRCAPEARAVTREGNRHVLYSAAVALVRAGRHDVMDGLTCRACAGTPDKFRQRFVEHPRSFLELAHHFRAFHVTFGFGDERDYVWSDLDWLGLASGEDVFDALAALGPGQPRAVFDELFPLRLVGPVREDGGSSAPDSAAA